MKKIVYIPLDERPCNLLYPKYMLEGSKDVKLVTPPMNLLGKKKRPCDIDKLWDFINEEVKDAFAIVMSIEMVIYGGLLPSRIHNLSKSDCERYFKNIRNLKSINKNIKIYASNLIMRTPKYNSSDEEPDYYEEYGERIFKRAYLKDKKERVGLSEFEENELKEILNTLPKKYYEDYENRRNFNINNNLKVLDFVKNNNIDFLSIPQDDSSEFGYTAMDQKKVVNKIKQERLQRKVYMYPGADEVGSALIARAISEYKNKKLKIYPLFSSTLGPTIIPLYEDRIINESLKSHVMVTNSILVQDYKDADIVLAYNTPGKVMQESWEQDNKDITYSSFRNLTFFVENIKQCIDDKKEVIIADCAFSNGGDLELISLLDNYEVLDKLLSYKGWNTNCNTLGTTLAAGVTGFEGQNRLSIKKNIIYHILEDGFYQGKVRMDVNNNILDKMGLNYFDLKDKADEVGCIIDDKLNKCYNQCIKKSFTDIKEIKINSFAPWNRMFERGIELSVKIEER
ncbi:DUF4127 family protein [Paraclostridium bifermentans]|uniref:DUF4127 family protein n=1 Tax=Paraclostridium bifermentans TaxID=1490 RepID=UPI0018A9B1B5|nr:DUF4127 family protein [Paraclostridium bifermentans]